MELSTEERAAAVAAVRLLGGRAAEVLAARVSARCAEAARALAADGPEEVARRAEALAAARPARLDLVHPSWIAPAPAAGDGAAPEVRRWLERAATAHLVDMVDEPPVNLPPDALVRELEERGRRRLALALRAVPPAARAAVAAGLGAEHGPRLARELALPAEPAEVSAAVRDLADLVAAGDTRTLLLRAGLRTLPRDGDLQRQVLQRLPKR